MKSKQVRMKLKWLRLFQSKASGLGGSFKSEFSVPTTKPNDIKQKMENKRMEKSKAQVSPTPSVVSSARSQFSSLRSDEMDLADVRSIN